MFRQIANLFFILFIAFFLVICFGRNTIKSDFLDIIRGRILYAKDPQQMMTLIDKSAAGTIRAYSGGYRIATSAFVTMYGYYPGDVNTRKLQGGNQNHKIDANEETLFWEHLKAAKSIKNADIKPIPQEKIDFFTKLTPNNAKTKDLQLALQSLKDSYYKAGFFETEHKSGNALALFNIPMRYARILNPAVVSQNATTINVNNSGCVSDGQYITTSPSTTTCAIIYWLDKDNSNAMRDAGIRYYEIKDGVKVFK